MARSALEARWRNARARLSRDAVKLRTWRKVLGALRRARSFQAGQEAPRLALESYFPTSFSLEVVACLAVRNVRPGSEADRLLAWWRLYRRCAE